MSALPDVLMVTHRVPYPPDKGDRIRTFHLLRFLSRYANVHVATLSDEEPRPVDVAALASMCARLAVVPVGRGRFATALSSILLGGSISEGMFSSSPLTAVIGEWSRETRFAGAIASASSVARYLLDPGLNSTARVVDVVDADSQKWLDYAADSSPPRRWVYAMEGRRVRRLESDIARWADAVTLVSEHETQLFRVATAAAKAHAVTNGVDLDYYRPTPEPTTEDCVFVGALDYRPNVEGIVAFCQEVWPRLHAAHPATRLRIVGRRPVAKVAALAAVAGVDVVGQVPDVRPHLRDAAVVVAPLGIARGLQNKVLEAMAAGKPVVASPQALGGFGHRDELPAIAATTPDDWLAHVSGLLKEPEERDRLGRAGRTYAERHHDWADCLRPMLNLLRLPTTEAFP